jgi:hypothetical protein
MATFEGSLLVPQAPLARDCVVSITSCNRQIVINRCSSPGVPWIWSSALMFYAGKHWPRQLATSDA